MGPPTKGNVSILDNNDDYLTDPGFKVARGSIGSGGGGPIGSGGGTFGSATFGGGGGMLGGLATTAGGNGDALRTLLRRRLRAPAATVPSYLAPADGKFSADTSGLSTNPTMTSFGRMPSGSRTPSGGGTPGRMTSPMPVNPAISPPNSGGGSWDPNDPNSAPDSPWANGDNGFLQNLITILGRFNATGAFTPNGSSAVMDAVRGNAADNAQALLSRNRLTSQALGVDPATAASYALQSDLRGQGGAADAVNDAALKQLLGQQEFGQDMLSTYLRGVFGMKGQQQDSGGSDLSAWLSAIGQLIPG